MTGLLRRGAVLGLLAAASALGLLASAQSWFTAVGAVAGTPADGRPDDAVAFSGGDATGGLSQTLATVVLAGVLLTLVLAVRGRRVVAVLLALCGAGMVILGALRTPPSDDAVRTRLRQVSLADMFTLDNSGWPWLYATAGLLTVAGAVLLWIGAPRWPQRGQRFERRPPRRIPDAADDPAAAWRALDAGLDPTLDATSDADEDSPSDPDVRSADTPDTMVQSSTQSSTHSSTHSSTRGQDQEQGQSLRRQDGER